MFAVTPPPGWHVHAARRLPAVMEAYVVLVASNAPIRARRSQCRIATFAPPADGATLVVAEWSTGGTGWAPARSPAQAARMLRIRRGPIIECYPGRGGAIGFVWRRRALTAYAMVGRRAPPRVLAQLRVVLASLRLRR